MATSELLVVFGDRLFSFFFFFNDTATTEIYTLSLHDALPISNRELPDALRRQGSPRSLDAARLLPYTPPPDGRSEEHTSELQSPCNLVCRLLLEKKKTEALSANRRHDDMLTEQATHMPAVDIT